MNLSFNFSRRGLCSDLSPLLDQRMIPYTPSSLQTHHQMHGLTLNTHNISSLDLTINDTVYQGASLAIEVT